MNEYTITQGTKHATLSGNSVQWVDFKFASVFKVRSRAEAIAKKHGGVVEPFYGKTIAGMKAFVAPKQSPINRHSAYRSI